MDFLSQGVVVAEQLEGGRVGFESGGVGEGVVTGHDAGQGDVLGSPGGRVDVDGCDVPAQVGVEGIVYHLCAALLTLPGVAGDVWRGNKRFIQQGGVDVRLALPAVDGQVAAIAQQCLGVAHTAAGSIEQQAAPAGFFKKPVVAQVPRGPLSIAGERCVEGDDVAALQHLIER